MDFADWIIVGILLVLLYIFALGFKYIAIQAIQRFYSYGLDDDEDDEGNIKTDIK